MGGISFIHSFAQELRGLPHLSVFAMSEND